MECKDFEPSIIQDNENEYINISKAFSSSLVERIGTSTILNSFVPIKQIAEAKGLKSTRSLRLEINKPESQREQLSLAFWIGNQLHLKN